ncbi:MAG: hypothetical protein JO209_07360 [Acidisphaera sp.]|nr:hypothetical protein [Acidisphaera sp.]
MTVVSEHDHDFDSKSSLCHEQIVIYHFSENLGRRSGFDYPGWYRSFALAANYAERHKFAKIIHIESDAFLISERAINYCNQRQDGWTALWCPHHAIPESGIQIIAGKELEAFFRFCRSDYTRDGLNGVPIELILPFTNVEKNIVGDRFAEYFGLCPPGC